MNTNIYALTDSHQECRNLSQVLSGIYNCEKNNEKPFIVLDAGDLFKGIYNKDLSVNAYIKLKQLIPNAQIFITLGNNDFGFKKEDFDYLKTTVKKFKANGISILCANVIDSKTGIQLDFIEPYKIIQINNQKILITGFCLNNSCAKKFGCELICPEIAFKSLVNSVKEEYNKIIVLHHHWYPHSKKLSDFAQKIQKPIDLIIGGHEHSPIEPDYTNKIFYPLSFARTFYKMALGNNISNIEQIQTYKINFAPEFEAPIIEYEQKTGLKTPIAKRVLDLTKRYSEPCPLGTFISDNMKKIGKTDIAFHSTGFTMYPLKLSDSPIITKYDFEKVICATTTLEVIQLNVEQLKQVFENATKLRPLRDRGNSQFLQCSQNITITGKTLSDQTYQIIQISINGENLLDENNNPIDKSRIFTCTIDSYIGNGEQGFEVLKNIPKSVIYHNDSPIKINELFYNAIIDAEKNFDGNTSYPSFKLIDL